MEKQLLVKNHNLRLAKLKGTDKTSALISGFAMVTSFELDIMRGIVLSCCDVSFDFFCLLYSYEFDIFS